MRQIAVLLLAMLTTLGCGDATGILVEVTSSDLAIGADLDTLRFQVRSNDDRSVDRTYRIDGAWPHSLTIEPASDADRDLSITVAGLKDGSVVVRRVVRTSFQPGTTRRVEVVLSRACLHVECAPGVDCLNGTCVGAPPLDGGVGDAGPGPDGGPDPDAGLDGGADAGPELDAGGDGGADAGSDAGSDTAGPLLISEYVEGSSNNKALELANLGSAPFALERCALNRYANGTTTPTPIALEGTVSGHGVFVLCHGSLEIQTACDQISSALNHNGNDAYALVCDGVVVDTFGRIGEDPGEAWTGGGLSTKDYVLVRCTDTPDPDGADPFDPSDEWQGEPWVDAATSLAGLGTRGSCL